LNEKKQRTSAVSFRIDREQIRDNSDGSIEVPGHLTRTGVFEYHRGDATIRELRSDAEVFADEALDSLRNVLVTKDHPPEFLSTDNWREHSIGHVSHVAAAPPYVDGRLRVFDKDAIHQIKAGFLTEVSCGYACKTRSIEREDADVEQVGLAYNHVAIGPDGWSRLGTQLRLDSNDQEVIEPLEKEINMEELEKALEPVLDAIKGLEEKYDSLSETLQQKAEEAEAEEKTDSPVQHHEEVPDPETIEQLVDRKAREIASLELRARDAHREIFPKATVEPELCGRQLCEEVIKTSDAKFQSKDDDPLSGLVREAELVAWKQRNDRAEHEETGRAGTAKRLREQLLAPVSADALQTKKSALRERILG
jgi:hypothetical protein